MVFSCILPTTRADLGLSPVRNVRRKAHCKNGLTPIRDQTVCHNSYILAAEIYNHLRKDLRAHCELVNDRELIRTVHMVLSLRESRAEGYAVL